MEGDAAEPKCFNFLTVHGKKNYNSGDDEMSSAVEFFFFLIRVVNAFRQGLDTRYEGFNPTLTEVLRKQTSFNKRLSQTSSIEYADNVPDELTIPEIDVERLSSHSHTETAV
ncbi:hypothetical protein RUM43_011928 [Polyplax serrata]|uniref:Uncharacterized protein n=1 Tax=Polyplax serrata TaxID=468196 RepID=A0AAN8S494_POLSC